MSQRQSYKYSIPRNVKQKFELMGLTWRQLFLVMLPAAGIAYLLFRVLTGPPKIIFPVLITFGSWVSMTQEINGETIYEVVKNMVLDLFRPKHHYWEEVDHARYYQRIDWREEENRWG